MTSNKNHMFLGDGENEISADTHGETFIYMGAVSSHMSIGTFLQDFLQFEKKVS